MKLILPGALSAALFIFGCHGHKGAVVSAKGPELSAAPSDHWLSERGREHPLVGKIWDVEHRAFIAPERVFDHLRRAGSRTRLLLGEKHDNPDHHRLQAELVRALALPHRSGTVAFEMFDVSQQGLLDRYVRSPGSTADGLGPALGWSQTGWPPWPTYAPIARVAMELGLVILGANLPPVQVRAVAHEGMSALDAAKVNELRLNEPFPPELEGPLLSELQTAHCGHLPAAALSRMAAAQHARDAQMAAVVVRTAGPVALIAGAGHVRKDHGVPYFARRTDASLQLESLAFIEVENDVIAPESYASRFASASLPFDLVWFTPRASDDDPCAAFHK